MAQRDKLRMGRTAIKCVSQDGGPGLGRSKLLPPMTMSPAQTGDGADAKDDGAGESRPDDPGPMPERKVPEISGGTLFEVVNRLLRKFEKTKIKNGAWSSAYKILGVKMRIFTHNVSQYGPLKDNVQVLWDKESY